MKHWYAVYTQPRNEERAQEHLARQGFEVFLPRYLKRRSHARRVTVAPAPLFPRYLFVSFDAAQQRWRAIRSTRGVIDLVSNGETPVPVPETVIRKWSAGAMPMVSWSWRVISISSAAAKIRIDSGPFAAYEAIFEANAMPTALLRCCR